MTTYHGFITLCFCLIALSFATKAHALEPGVVPDQLRLVWEQDPAHSVRLLWTTEKNTQHHAIYYDTMSHKGTLSAYAEMFTNIQSTRYKTRYQESPYVHQKVLKNLKPSTTYYFVVQSGLNVSREIHFKTAPADFFESKNNKKFKILYGGDSRSSQVNRQAVNRHIAKLAENDPAIIGFAHGGDFIADGRKLYQWMRWLDDHQLTITKSGRILPIMPARGNHERDGILYNKVFGHPGGSTERNYFATDFGKNLRFITLDTGASLFGKQREWLEKTLKNSKDKQWVVVNYHIPAWPAVKLAGPAKLHWVPLFEQYEVDLVCESDGHALKRTVPIKNNHIDPTGVVYVGEGGLGVKQRVPKKARWYLQSPGMTMSAHHVQVLTFSKDALDYEAVLLDGTVADRYTRNPKDIRKNKLKADLAPEITKPKTLVQIKKPKTFKIYDVPPDGPLLNAPEPESPVMLEQGCLGGQYGIPAERSGNAPIFLGSIFLGFYGILRRRRLF